MVVTYMPSMAFAAAGDEGEEAAVTEVQEDAVTEESVQEEPAEQAVEDVQAEEPEAQAEEDEVVVDAAPADQEAGLPKTAPGKFEHAAPAKMTPEAEIAGNDELLEQFFESEVDKALGRKASAGKLRARKSPRRDNLNYTEQYIYDEILANMQDVATGNASSAEFSINLRDELEGYLVETGISNYPWAITYESLGLESAKGVYIPYEYEDESGETQEYWDLSGEAKEILFDIDKVVNALLADQPYYAYWFDKTRGYSSGLNAGLDTDGGEGSDAYFEDDPMLTISFTVAADYRAEGGSQYDINQEKAASTVAAVATVEQIVAQNAEASDVDKLYAYKDVICDMTSYNDEAAAGGVEYGDPWQLIWVFDGDDKTNVVCEGYSKAFQFLCDKTSFIDSRIECLTVTGTMDGGTGAGNHMWNILRMDDGENYIADITNCDEGSVGYPEALFLKGYDSREGDGYTYSGVHYVYDSETLEMYGQYTDLYMTGSDYRKVEWISFNPVNGPLQLKEDQDGEWTDDDESGSYFRYEFPDWPNFENGDELTVKYTDADEALTYQYYGYDEEAGEMSFSRFDGDKWDVINSSDLSYYSNQDDPWEVGGEGYIFTLMYCGATAEYPVEVVESDVVKPVSMTWNYMGDQETVRGITDTSFIYEDDFYYDGNELVITFEDGSTQTYICRSFDNGDGDIYTGYFLDGDTSGGEESEFTSMHTEVANSEGVADDMAVFSEGDNQFYIIADIGNYQVEAGPYNAVGIENPDKIEISYTSAQELKENKGGDMSSDEDGEFYFYWISQKDGDVLTVNGTDYVFDSERWEYIAEDGSVIDGDDVYFNTDCQNENHWVIPDGETETVCTFTVEYQGATGIGEVTLVQNPVAGISFTPVNEYVDLIENVNGYYYDEDEEGQFIYSVPYFEEGDLLTVYYRNNEQKSFAFNGEEDQFINLEDESDRIDTWGSDGIDWDSDQSEQWTVTTGDDYYEKIVTYEGYTAVAKKIRIIENPVDYITFSRNGENKVELTEGKDSEITATSVDGEIVEYEYYSFGFRFGDVITLHMKDGSEVAYEYTEMDEEYEYSGEFINADGDMLHLDEERRSFRTDQDYDNQWQAGGSYTATLYCYGKTTEVDVEILPNPVTNVVFERDGSKTVQLVEGVDGVMDWDWDEDDNKLEYFRYNFPYYREGDTLTVTENGGIKKYEFAGNIYNAEEDSYDEAFVNVYDSSDIIYTYSIDEYGSDQSAVAPWTRENAGADYHFDFKCLGFRYSVPVEIIENPVSEIDFLRDGYDEDHPIELTEGIDAELNSDGGNNRWFEYYLTFKNGDTIRITDPDNNTSDYNAVKYSDNWDEVKHFQNDEGKKIKPYEIAQSSDQSFENQWVPGDGDHEINLEYFTRTKGVKVRIKENPVQKISFVRPDVDAIPLLENGDGYDDDWTFRYEIRFKAGDELYVTYAGTEDPVKYVAEAGSDGKVYEFNASGAVPEGAAESIGTYELDFRHNCDYQLNNLDEGETATLMLLYKSMWCDVPVEIVENPVESIEYIWAEGGDRAELIEGKDGYTVTYMEEDIAVFEYELPYTDGDTLKVQYKGVDEPVEYVFDNNDYVFKAAGDVPEGAPTGIASSDIRQRTNQRLENQWTVGNEYEIELTYLGSKFIVPVVIIEGEPDDPYNINSCEVSFDEQYLVQEEIESTPYPDYFYVVHTGTTLTPIVVADGTTLDPDCYSERYSEVGFNEDANEWQIIDEGNWSGSFPTEAGVYYCEVSGVAPYYGTYDGLLPLVRIEGHSWDGGQITKQATETEEGITTYTCTICGATKTESIPPLGHTHNPVHTGAKAATCSETGNTEYWFCEGCGKYFGDENCTTELTDNSWVVPVDMSAHAWGSWHKFDAEKHERVCANNSAHTEYAAHSWNGGEITKQATETEEGVRTYTCTVCGETRTETIPVVQHTHSMEHTAAKAATCTTAGNIEYWYCTSCEKFFSDGAGTNEITQSATVTPVDKNAHVYGEWQKYDANEHRRVCLNDGSHIDSAPHEWDEGEVTKPQTETEEGIMTYTCDVCGETRTEVIPPDGSGDTEPKLIPETLWLGCEYLSPASFDADMDGAELISVTSSNTGVIAVHMEEVVEEIYDYNLEPVSAGTSTITVEYKLNGERKSASAVFTVKPFPAFASKLTIDGEEVDLDSFKNYYDLEDYTETAPLIKFTLANGWTLRDAYYFISNDDGDTDYPDMDTTHFENGVTLDYPEDYTSLCAFFYFTNADNEEIMYGVRLYRESGEDIPSPIIQGNVRYTCYNGDNTAEAWAVYENVGEDGHICVTKGDVVIQPTVDFGDGNPKTVKSVIGFQGATEMTSVSLPSTIETIEEDAFLNTGLTYIEIPSSVQEIGEHALGFNNEYDEATDEYVYVPVEGFTIKGKAGSAAETYAKNNGFTFTTDHKHSLTATAAKEATCTTAGNSAYWTCSECGKYFSDAAGTKEIEKNSWVIAAPGHKEVVIPAVAATCTKAGTTEGKKCSVCGTVTVSPLEIPAKGHVWGDASYTWTADYTEVTGTHTCTACGEKETDTAKRASSEVIKVPTAKEKGEIKYTSEAFTVDGFEVQTKSVEIELSAEEKAIDEANDQANDASGKADAAENSNDEAVISAAEDSAAKAAELAAQAEAAAESAFDKAESAYEAAVKSGDTAQIETAKSNLDVAINNLVTAKVIKAAATSSLAKAKKAAAKVASNKAAAASAAAEQAADPIAAEELRKEAETYAAQAAEKAASAETASAASSKAAEDLGKLADNKNVDPAVQEEVKKEKAKADKSAGAASESAQAAETSSEEAKASEAEAAETVVEKKRQGVLDKSIPKMTIKTKTSKKTSITIKWKWTTSGKKKLKKSKATKYEIWVCPNTKFAKADTIVKTCSKSKTSYTVKSLKKYKKYYFKIRAIKYVGGVKHVGPWSSRKYIKTKKK